MADSAGKSESEPGDTSTVRKDGGPSAGGRGDSKAETDQSDTSRNDDFCEKLKGLDISRGTGDSNAKTDQSDAELTISKREEQEPAHDKETPQQERDSGVAPLGKVKKNLFPDASANQSNNGTEKKNEFKERKDGEWLEDHPWQSKTPNSQTLTEKTVYMSEVYTVSDKWLTNGKVNREKIYLDLTTFIDEMKGLSIRQELEDVLEIDTNSLTLQTNSTLLKAIDFKKVKRTPHVLEITQKHDDVAPKDKPSRPSGKNDNLKAFSLPSQQNPHEPSEKNRWFLDCEYMLKMYLPDDLLEWFKTDDQQGKRISKINTEKKDKRWIFIPSFRRAGIALLDWPQDDIVTKESTIRILVVRPSEFEEYVAYCGHLFPVICLPQDEIGAGYPRYWIQKIAMRLELQFIWMIDDSVDCFYEYHPKQMPPKRQDREDMPGRDYKNYRRRKFGLVFEHIENFVKKADAVEKPIAAMSPKRFDVRFPLETPFVCKPPRIAVFLNLTALKSKELYYRPELQTLEDMIFGYECEENFLKVFIDNRIHLWDHGWQDTGARYCSVKQKPT